MNKILKRENFFIEKNLKFDFINSSWQLWQPYYYQHYAVDVLQTSLGSGLHACLAAFSFRILPKGKIEYKGNNQYIVTIEQTAGFVHDLFNFEGEDQFLGYWSCAEKKIKYEPLTKNDTYVTMSNSKFNSFREHTKNGNDFLVLSQPKIIDNFNQYTYDYLYE